MGILRTDKISGLETPTAVTGSVYFDGDARNDNLIMSADYGDLDFQNTDFTFESWVYPTDMSADRYWCSKGDGNLPGTAMDVRFDSDGQIRINFYVSSTAYSLHTSSGVLQENVWSHVAVVRNGTSFKSYVNGKETSSATHNITVSDVSATFAIGILQGVGTGFKGYMSNFRFVRGKAVYIGEFTPSIYALEPIDGTVLLCCNNPDSAGAASYAGIGISKTITVNGDAAASTVSPGLTRDFTGGTEFQGVTIFDTQGYFVPPSGTTEQRGRGRGLWAGGDNPGGGDTKIIDFIQIQSGGIGLDFGDLTVASNQTRGVSSFTRGVFGGGRRPHPATSNIMDYVTIATTSNAVDFGDLTDDRAGSGEISSSTRGIFAAGYNPANTNTIDFITIASLGNAQDFGDTVNTANGMAGTQSQTRGILAGANGPSSPNASNVIQFLTIATTGNAQDFGDLTDSRHSASGTSNGIRAIFMGGDHLSPAADTTIDYITISTTGNAQDFGDLETITVGTGGATSDKIRGVFALGYSGSAHLNVIQQVTIATTGNAVQVGDLTALRHQPGCLSDTHGGLS